MKKVVRIVSVVVMLGILLAVPAQADAAIEPRASAFFSAYGTFLYKTGASSLQIWFDVDSNAAMMDELGVSTIELYRSPDMQTWTKVKTYDKADYPVMIDRNSYSYIAYVTYGTALPGFYYCAYVTFYAKNSIGIGERYVYTDILQM